MRNALLFVLILCYLPMPAAAAAAVDTDCALLEKRIWEKASPEEKFSLDQFDQGLCACKRVPDDATQAIIVAGKRLVMVDVATGEVLSDGGDINMDTNSRPGFSIDTARYWVAPGVRAFGVRGWVSPPHHFSEEQVEQLNLYVRKGKDIVPILEKLMTQDADDGVSVNGCTESSNCTGNMSDFRRSIEITKTATNGYFDLAVVEMSRHCDGAETRAACKKSETWRNEVKRTYTLRYNGTTYRPTPDVDENMLFE